MPDVKQPKAQPPPPSTPGAAPAKEAAQQQQPPPPSSPADQSPLDVAIGSVIAAFTPVGLAKPKLTRKLLVKPPFRFLHDLMSSVTASTGFGAGLFSEAEADARGFKDRDAKVAYVEKLAALVGACADAVSSDAGTGAAVSLSAGRDLVSASKVVGGREPERTAWLLELLAGCALACRDGGEAAKARAARAVDAIVRGGAAPPQADRFESAKVSVAVNLDAAFDQMSSVMTESLAVSKLGAKLKLKKKESKSPLKRPPPPAAGPTGDTVDLDALADMLETGEL